MLLNLPDEILERIFNYLDRKTLKKVIRVYPPWVRFEKRWMKKHLKKVYVVDKNRISKWATKYVPYND